MPISHATTDSVELEILELRHESSDDDDGDGGDGLPYERHMMVPGRGRRPIIPVAGGGIRRQQMVTLGGSSTGPTTTLASTTATGEGTGDGSPPKRRKRYRRNRTSTRRKSNSQSCGSLYNLAATRPLYQQRSEPNVNFYSSPGEPLHRQHQEYHQYDRGGGGTIDVDFHAPDSSNTLDDAPVLESCETLGALRSRSGIRCGSAGTGRLLLGSCGTDGGLDYNGPGGGGCGGGLGQADTDDEDAEEDDEDDDDEDDDGDDVSTGGCLGGSNVVGSGGGGCGGGGSIGGNGGTPHHPAGGQHGLRASIASVLGKLSVWHTNKKPAKATTVPTVTTIHRSETKSSFDRGQSYISNGATRLRSIFGGKHNNQQQQKRKQRQRDHLTFITDSSVIITVMIISACMHQRKNAPEESGEGKRNRSVYASTHTHTHTHASTHILTLILNARSVLLCFLICVSFHSQSSSSHSPYLSTLFYLLCMCALSLS